MAQQTALFLDAKCGTFVVREHPIPSPSTGDLLVKIYAAGLNPVDWAVQARGMFVKQYPTVLGLDAAGEVERVGEGVVGWSKGDRVLFEGNYLGDAPGGTFQQYTLIKATLAVKIPDSISYSQAATIPLAFITSAVGIWAPKPLGPGLEPSWDGTPHYTGQPVLLLGGSSSVGQYAIQILKISGYSPIITYASSKHADYLKSLGATHVVDRQTTPLADLPSAIHQITTEPIKLVVNAVSSEEAQNVGYDLVAAGGQFVAISLPPGEIKNLSDDKPVVKVFGSVYESHYEFGRELLKHLEKLLADGDIKPNRFEVLPGGLGGIVGGLERLKKNEVSGIKLIAHPQE